MSSRDSSSVRGSPLTTLAVKNAAITWAASYGVATGNSATTFNPWGNCNRAATVTFLYRLTHLD
ncbi:MAG: S-layer homology domain-containing protein [Lachnospiraceae bacterium]|nr:S-layer homology domain-containing protein [Lachnospiraceae bacterium]